MKRIVNALGNLIRGKRASAVVLCVTAVIVLPAQTLTTLHNFDGTNGADPFAGLVQATNGDLYGTTENGGANGGGGTIFRITPTGTLTTLYSFCSQTGCTDGDNPYAGLIQATNGNFYGTTGNYGANGGGGTIFKITPSGTLTTLYSFCAQSRCTDGEFPAGLIQASDGNFYGTTSTGGANIDCINGTGGCGTVFKITPSGALTTLYSFCAQSGCPDGEYPSAGLVQAANGDFYGTTNGLSYSGTNPGTVFKITPDGTLTTLYSFCSRSGCTDGQGPSYGALLQATNGDLYGTTLWGGDNNSCSLGCGTVFKITPGGTLTTLYSFSSQGVYPDCTDGDGPFTGLVQASNGNLYGTTSAGGANGQGTIFEITTSGTLTTLLSFCSMSGCRDGEIPVAALVPGYQWEPLRDNREWRGRSRWHGLQPVCGSGSFCGRAARFRRGGNGR